MSERHPAPPEAEHPTFSAPDLQSPDYADVPDAKNEELRQFVALIEQAMPSASLEDLAAIEARLKEIGAVQENHLDDGTPFPEGTNELGTRALDAIMSRREELEVNAPQMEAGEEDSSEQLEGEQEPVEAGQEAGPDADGYFEAELERRQGSSALLRELIQEAYTAGYLREVEGADGKKRLRGTGKQQSEWFKRVRQAQQKAASSEQYKPRGEKVPVPPPREPDALDHADQMFQERQEEAQREQTERIKQAREKMKSAMPDDTATTPAGSPPDAAKPPIHQIDLRSPERRTQDEAYETYGSNLAFSKAREAQDKAFETYAANLAATERREQGVPAPAAPSTEEAPGPDPLTRPQEDLEGALPLDVWDSGPRGAGFDEGDEAIRNDVSLDAPGTPVTSPKGPEAGGGQSYDELEQSGPLDVWGDGAPGREPEGGATDADRARDNLRAAKEREAQEAALADPKGHAEASRILDPDAHKRPGLLKRLSSRLARRAEKKMSSRLDGGSSVPLITREPMAADRVFDRPLQDAPTQIESVAMAHEMAAAEKKLRHEIAQGEKGARVAAGVAARTEGGFQLVEQLSAYDAAPKLAEAADESLAAKDKYEKTIDAVAARIIKPDSYEPVVLEGPEKAYSADILRKFVGREAVPAVVQTAVGKDGRLVLERVFISPDDKSLALIDRRDVESGQDLGLVAVHSRIPSGKEGDMSPLVSVKHEAGSMVGELRRLGRMKTDVPVASDELASALDVVRDRDHRRYEELERSGAGQPKAGLFEREKGLKSIASFKFRSAKELNEYLLRTQEGISHTALEEYRQKHGRIRRAKHT